MHADKLDGGVSRQEARDVAAAAGRLYGHDHNGRAHNMLDLNYGNHLAGLKRPLWNAYAVGLQAPELQARSEAGKLLPLDVSAPPQSTQQHFLLQRLVSALGGGNSAAPAASANNNCVDAGYASGLPLQLLLQQLRQAPAAAEHHDIGASEVANEAAADQERAAKRMRLQLLEKLLQEQQLANTLQVKQEQQDHEQTLLHQLRQHQQQHREEHQNQQHREEQQEQQRPAAGLPPPQLQLQPHLMQLLQSATAVQPHSCGGGDVELAAGTRERSPNASMATASAAPELKSEAEADQQHATAPPIVAAVKAELVLEPEQLGAGRGASAAGTGTGTGADPVADSKSEGAEPQQQQNSQHLSTSPEHCGAGPQGDQPLDGALREQHQPQPDGSPAAAKTEPGISAAAVVEATSPSSDVTAAMPTAEAVDGVTDVSAELVRKLMEVGTPAAAAAAAATESEEQDLSAADDSAAVAAFLLRLREAAVQGGDWGVEADGADGEDGQQQEVEEAPLPEVDILPLEAPEEGMLDAGDGVFVCPATAGPGITYWPLWTPDPNGDQELFPRVVRGLRTRPSQPARPISSDHYAKLRKAVAPDPRTPRTPRAPLLGGLHPAALAQLLAAQQQQQLQQLQLQQLQQLQQQMPSASALGQQYEQPRFLVQRGVNGQPMLMPLTGAGLAHLASGRAGNAAVGAKPHVAALLARLTGAEPSSATSSAPAAALVAAALAGDASSALLLAQQQLEADAGLRAGACGAGGLLKRGTGVSSNADEDHGHGHDHLGAFAAGRPHHHSHLHPRQHAAGGPIRGLHQQQQLHPRQLPHLAARHHPYSGQGPAGGGGADKQQAVLPMPGVIGAAWVPPPPPRPPRNHRGPLLCSNCGTTQTPLWRKDRDTGATVCNACGIYKQTHNADRPVESRAEPPLPVLPPARRQPAQVQQPQQQQQQQVDRGATAVAVSAIAGQRQLEAALEVSNRWAHERSTATATAAVAAEGGRSPRRSVPQSPSHGAAAEEGLEGARGAVSGEWAAAARPLQLQLGPLTRELSLQTLPLGPLHRDVDAEAARLPGRTPSAASEAPPASPPLAATTQRLLDLNRSPEGQLVAAGRGDGGGVAGRAQGCSRAASPLRLDETAAVDGAGADLERRPLSPLRLSVLPPALASVDGAGVGVGTHGDAAGGSGAGGASGLLLQHMAQQVRSRQEDIPEASQQQQQQQQGAAAENTTAALLRQLLSALHRAQAGGAAAGQDSRSPSDAAAKQRECEPGSVHRDLQEPAGGAAGAVKLRTLDMAGEGVVGTGADRAGEGHEDARLKILQALQLHRQQQQQQQQQDQEDGQQDARVQRPLLQRFVGGAAGAAVPRISIDLTNDADEYGSAPRHAPLMPPARHPQSQQSHLQLRPQPEAPQRGLGGLAFTQLPSHTESCAGAGLGISGHGLQLQLQDHGFGSGGSGWADDGGHFGAGGLNGYGRGGGRDRPQLMLHPMAVDPAGGANVSPVRQQGAGRWLQL
ncbi:hypothetical protein HXX76_005152 [Chlamydomonas incerta]|uniref:GATA-type domain-containing protein n=1 Tax=Chlamydomonas incerta TaxID=51695 RepID=A0A835T7S8_CHLIN|nr:hypothetical protein HXX76_005152 [Chlamydomonas incerta]|eukprot:KAG2438602.1 hypothetical protein HXX76_005152 [Chlamydomonas incerta]